MAHTDGIVALEPGVWGVECSFSFLSQVCALLIQNDCIYRRPKSRRSKRFLENRSPKLIENPKNTMLVRGGNANLTVSLALKNLWVVMCGAPGAGLQAVTLKNLVRPFEDPTSLEFFSKKSDCSLFVFASHNKKRPNNLIFGRMFDYHLLDMFEMGMESFRLLGDLKVEGCPEGTKPLLVFAGELFDTQLEFQRLKSLLTDFFCGPRVPARKTELVLLKKSGCRTPRVELQEMGPSFDFSLRRNHMASDDLYKLAHKQPKGLMPKTKKNISHNAFGSKLGRIHMQRQDLNKMQTRKMKGLRKRRRGGMEAPETEETSSNGKMETTKTNPRKRSREAQGMRTSGKKMKRRRKNQTV
ncbi:hypothetical protein DNTS_031804 [Danionella cerebrum]|uniref:Ribosome production factor 2 homolog n=1 Tax=Danionella cerebrum TaxID=2873325 RepID=A0A553QCT6_9TELE|nr:hypothetical protein DNTS_031804 [Danionella translucida]